MNRSRLKSIAHARSAPLHMRQSPDRSRHSRQAFTLVELLVVGGMLALLACLLVPCVARTNPVNKTNQCMNNLRQLTTGFRAWSIENNDVLLAAQSSLTAPGSVPRPLWVTGNLDFSGANPSNWNTNQDLAVSPLWNLVGSSPALFRCPTDKSSVQTASGRMLRVRSFSLSSVFARGEWLDRSYSSSQSVWRTYARFAEIVYPARTFCLIDEHPDSINDGQFANSCTGAQPGDPPATAQLIDFPASRHLNGANLSFSDGHIETHRWIGTKIRAAENYNGLLPLNVVAADSWMDAQWLAANTTVRK